MKTSKSRFLMVIIIILTVFISVPAVDAANAPQIFFNEVEIVFDQLPIIESGRTLVPIRAISEAAEMQVDYNPITKTATLTKTESLLKLPYDKQCRYVEGKTHVITITANEKTAGVDGNERTLDVPAKIVNGRIYVPLRFISDSMDMDVLWLDGNKIMINDRLRGSIALEGEKVFPTLKTNSISCFNANNGKVTLGMDVADMLKSAGPPSSISGATRRSKAINYKYENEMISCLLGKVAVIMILPDSNWKTEAGISAGSSLDDIAKAYSLSEAFVNQRNRVEEGGITLVYQGNKLVDDYETATHIIRFMFFDNTDIIRTIQISDNATIQELAESGER